MKLAEEEVKILETMKTSLVSVELWDVCKERASQYSDMAEQ